MKWKTQCQYIFTTQCVKLIIKVPCFFLSINNFFAIVQSFFTPTFPFIIIQVCDFHDAIYSHIMTSWTTILWQHQPLFPLHLSFIVSSVPFFYTRKKLYIKEEEEGKMSCTMFGGMYTMYTCFPTKLLTRRRNTFSVAGMMDAFRCWCDRTLYMCELHVSTFSYFNSLEVYLKRQPTYPFLISDHSRFRQPTHLTTSFHIPRSIPYIIIGKYIIVGGKRMCRHENRRMKNIGQFVWCPPSQWRIFSCICLAVYVSV